MKSRSAFRIGDILAVLACVLILLMNLGAFGNATRERAKRAVCLANLGRLTMAWQAFADDHNGNIVNGAAGINRPGEPPWVPTDWHLDFYSGKQLPLNIQQKTIRSGALWPYSGSVNLYHCPAGIRQAVRTYAIVDSMNGFPQPNDTRGRGPVAKLIVKNIRNLTNRAARIVFIDEGWNAPDSYAVHYDWGCWWDDPPVIHNAGVTLSFADSHAEYWKWQGRKTILKPGDDPTTSGEWRDLLRVQIGVWGGLGYNPPVW